MTVLTVGSCLWQTVIWSVMFVLTLVQSRTHVHTVQIVLHGITNWRYICWSHTMKALGSHVTFVRRSIATEMSLRNTYIDMKMWSHMFAVNVQSVSIQTGNWKLISLYTLTLETLLVVFVLNHTSIRPAFWNTCQDVLLTWTLVIWRLYIYSLKCNYSQFVCTLFLFVTSLCNFPAQLIMSCILS